MKKILILLAVFFSFVFNAYALEEGLSVTYLPSGQKIIIKEVHDNPIVKIDTWINTGSINEDDKTTGLSHFLEHLFFKGTNKYPTGEMDKILDSKGAIVNAGTSKDFTHYYIQIPSKDFDLALDLHADMLQNPLIPRKELEKERPVVIEEISKCKDSPSTRLFDNMYTLLYSKSNHPYKRTVIGKKEVIQNITREEILDYFNKYYTPDAYTTVIVGDVNKNETLKKVAAAFNKTEVKKQTKVNYPKIKPLEKVEKLVETMDVNKSHMMMGFFAPKFSIEQDNYALDVLAVMLADGKSSILNKHLKEDKELVLSISSGNYSQKDSGMFYIYTTFEPKNEPCIEKEILAELKKVQQGNFDETQLTRAKNQIKTDTYYSRESISNISDDLGYDFTFSPNENYYENYLKNIEKVTKEDILRVAKKYLILDKYALSVIQATGFKEISNLDEKETKKTDTKLIQKNDDTKKVLLPNGAALITTKRKTNSIIAIDLSIKGSKAIEKKPATAALAASSATTGTKSYTNIQLAQFLDENGIKLGVTSTGDVFSIVVQTTKDNLDKALSVLDEVINYPTFSDYEINKIRSRKIQDLKGVSDNPARYVFDEFKKLAFKGSIYGQNSQFLLNHINQVTREDIVDFYTRVMNPENMSIAVVGDINEDEIADKLSSIIKKNEKGSKFEYSNVDYKAFEPAQNVESTIYKNEVQANWIALGYKTCGVLNRRDIAVLKVINSILGEGMSSRLFTKLREDKGLAYTVGSTLNLNVLDGAFIAYIGTNKESIEQAKQGILDEIEILKKEMVTTKELNNAKDKIMGQFLLSLETNLDIANLMSWYSVLGRDINALEEYKKMIMEVSQADIIEIANKYFSKPYIYAVVEENK